MNSTRRAALDTQDVCGVWLDTADLRGQRKRPRLTHPISKLLNPFAPNSGYSMAVALNFTQTKLQMPVTKQTSITSFFVSRPKEMAAESTCFECVDGSSPALSDKRKSVMAETENNPRPTGHLYPQESLVHKDVVSGVDLSCALGTLECSPLLDAKCSFDEEKVPAVKKRLIGCCLVPPTPDNKSLCSGSHSLGVASESTEPLLSDCFTQDSQGKCVMAHHMPSAGQMMEGGFPDDLEGKQVYDGLMSYVSQTSTQRRCRASLPKILRGTSGPSEEGKENYYSAAAWCRGPSPVKYRPSSFHSPLQRWRVSSPLPQQPTPRSLHEDEQDTYDMLFTQDTQGQRVIAHRSSGLRNPLKDQTNRISCCVQTLSSSMLVEEDKDSELEPEMLFTQDSQGNVVIRH